MPRDNAPSAVLAEISAHERGDDLARLVHTVAFAAVDERRANLSEGLSEAAERLGIDNKLAETPYGNVLRALEKGSAEASGSATRALLAVLLARGVALSPPKGTEAEARVAEALVWLATHTSVDALGAIDTTLGSGASGLWMAVGELVRKADDGRAPVLGRAGAVIAAAALRQSTSDIARREARVLATEVKDPIVRSLVEGSSSPAGGSSQVARVDDGEAAVATGELQSGPRGPAMLLLLGVTGILAAMHVARFVGRVALRYRRPAEIRVTATGVTLKARTELLGKVLREREVHIPVEGLARAAREVKYPRLPMYAGLFALALGSYLGISFFIDGARAGSPELLGVGAILVALGVALDYALENASNAVQGRCRLVLIPRKGPAVALGLVDPTVADAALGKLIRT